MIQTPIPGVHKLDCFGPRVTAAFSERRFNETTRDSFLKKLSLEPVRFRKAKQVHGDVILNVTSENPFSEETEADGLVTNEPGTVIGIKTADCIPAFYWDPVRKAAGVAHAGWKGLKAGILVKMVRVFVRTFGSKASDLQIAFGPAIGDCCYEVGREFQDYFPGFYRPTQPGKGHVDLIRAARHQLMGEGVDNAHMINAGVCTACHSDVFYSARKGAQTERILSVISFR